MVKTKNLANFEVVGIILSGGAGTRMGGLDKGLQIYRNKPLVEHVITALKPQTSSITLCANRHIESYKQFKLSLVQDEHDKHEGPLAGISSALKFLIRQNSSASHAVISSCDTPHLPNDFVARLLENIGNQKVAAVFDGDRRQNLHCLIARNAWQDLINYFNDGERAIWKWQNSVEVTEVDFSDQAYTFANFNKLSDLKS